MSQPPPPFVNKVQETMRLQRRRNYVRTTWNVVDTFIHGYSSHFYLVIGTNMAIYKSEATNCLSISFQVFTYTNNNQH